MFLTYIDFGIHWETAFPTMSSEKYVAKYNHERLNNKFQGVFNISWDLLWVLFCGLLMVPDNFGY